MSAANTPGAWARVVLAADAALLSSGHKLVWLQIQTLDRSPERAFVSAANLARRLGMGLDNVENLRRDLRDVGLLASGPRPGRKATTWWPALPERCRPISERPSDDDVVALAQLLDGFIRTARDGVPQSASPPPPKGVLQSAKPSASNGVPESASSRAESGVPQSAEGGGKGEGASPLQLVVPTSPASCPVVEIQKEEGPFARERIETGVMPFDWRQILREAGALPPIRAPRAHEKLA